MGDPGEAQSNEQERLQRLIWVNRHLPVGKRHALLPEAREAVCDIDVGDANPIAQIVRPAAPKFRE